MSLVINITVEDGTAELGGTGVSVALGGMKYALEDLRWLWPTWRDIFWEIEAETFDNEGGASGPWEPLSEPYATWKAKHYGTPILVLSGRLRESLTGDSGDSVYEEYPQEMTVGTSVEYAGYHQTGTSRMPARPPIDIDSAQGRLFAEGLEAAARELENQWGPGGMG